MEGMSLEIPRVTPIEKFDAIIWPFFVIAFATTVMRLYTRLCIVRCFGLDDVLIVIGQLAAAGSNAMAHMQAGGLYEAYLLSLEAGRPLFRDTPASVHRWNLVFRYAFISDCIYLLALPIIKCSILAFFLRVTTKRKQRYVLYIVAFFIFGQGIANLLATIFAFEDPSAVWTVISTPTKTRYDNTDLQIVNSGFQVLFDVIILVLPIRFIFKTNFRGKARAGLVVIYILSFFNLAVTIVRLVTVIEFEKVSMDLYKAASKRVDYAYWTSIEITTAIMCANLPAMSAFLRFVKHDQHSSGKPLFYGKSSATSDQQNKSSSSFFSFLPGTLHRWLDKSLHSIRIAATTATSRRGSSDSRTPTQTELHEKKSASDFTELDYMSPSVKGGAGAGAAGAAGIANAYSTRISARNNDDADSPSDRFDFTLPMQDNATLPAVPAASAYPKSPLPPLPMQQQHHQKQHQQSTSVSAMRSPTTAATATATAVAAAPPNDQDVIYRTDEVEVASSLV